MQNLIILQPLLFSLHVQMSGLTRITAHANYNQCLNGGLRLIPDESERNILATDYRRIEEAGMFQVKPPEFIEIMSALHELELKCNKTLPR